MIDRKHIAVIATPVDETGIQTFKATLKLTVASQASEEYVHQEGFTEHITTILADSLDNALYADARKAARDLWLCMRDLTSCFSAPFDAYSNLKATLKTSGELPRPKLVVPPHPSDRAIKDELHSRIEMLSGTELNKLLDAVSSVQAESGVWL